MGKTLTKARLQRLAQDIKQSRAGAEIDSPDDYALRKAYFCGALQAVINGLVADLGHDATPVREAFESALSESDLAAAREAEARLQASMAEWRAKRAQASLTP